MARITTLGKRILQYQTATDDEIMEWIDIKDYNVTVLEVKKAIKTLPANQVVQFCKHKTKYGIAVTIDKFKKKPVTNSIYRLAKHYGIEIKVNRPNVYDPEYIARRDNITYNEAVMSIERYKQEKSTSLKNFIKRYDKTEGTVRYTNWYEATLKKGHTTTEPKSRLNYKWWVKQGFTENQSRELAVKHQHNTSPLHIEYYTSRGYDLTYATNEIRKLHDKKKGRNCYMEYLISTGVDVDLARFMVSQSRSHNTRTNLGDALFEERLAKTRKTLEAKGIWIPLEQLDDYELYRKFVWIETNKNNLNLLPNSDKRGLAGVEGAYQLDHKFSISAGYINDVSPVLVGSSYNLEFIPWEDNISKQGRCSITIEELYENYKN